MQVHCPGGDDVERGGDMTVVDHVKLLRNHPEIRRLGGQVEWTDIHVLHSGADQSPQGKQRKYDRDLRILSLDLEERPDHPFVFFNLGMTYADMGDFGEAADSLRRSIHLHGAKRGLPPVTGPMQNPSLGQMFLGWMDS